MKKTWVQDPETGKLTERVARPRVDTPAVHPDMEPFISPVDRSIIGSSRALREHNKRNDVKQHREYGEGNGEAYLAARNQERLARREGNTPDQKADRLRDIIRATEKFERSKL